MVKKPFSLQDTSYFYSLFAQKIITFIEEHTSVTELKDSLQKIMEGEEESFPLSIITKKLTVLESVVTYLKEERNCSLHSIAEILRRNEKNIWHAYHSATKKGASPNKAAPSKILVPLHVFSVIKLSPLEAVVAHLKDEQGLSFHEIAGILARDDRTVWTTYTRAKKKQGGASRLAETLPINKKLGQAFLDCREKLERSSRMDRSYSIFAQKILTLIEEQSSVTELKDSLQKIMEGEGESFPLSIITKKLTVLESVVKYLKEERNCSLHSIAEILRRNEKNIWHAYHSATKKVGARLRVEYSPILVPLDIFSREKFSPLEAVVGHLKDEQGLSFHEIAGILARDDRTVWTTYTRARRKYEEKA